MAIPAWRCSVLYQGKNERQKLVLQGQLRLGERVVIGHLSGSRRGRAVVRCTCSSSLGLDALFVAGLLDETTGQRRVLPVGDCITVDASEARAWCTALIAPLSDRLIRGQYPIHRRAEHKYWPSSSSVATTSAGARSTKRLCALGVGRGCWCPGRPLTTVEGRPRHPQRLARRRHADLHCAVGLPSAARSVFEVQSQQPGYFSLYVQEARAPGEPLSPRARAPSHPAGCVRPALRRASSGPTPEANPCAAPCAKPSDGSCTTPRGEAVDGRYCAVN